MLISLICMDKPNSGAIRAETRPAHLDYLKSMGPAIIFAGAMTNDAGDAVVGSKFLLEMDDMAAAQSFADGDPYAAKSLFQSTDLRPLRKAVWNPDSMTE